jgi:hypothetical protein
MMRAVNGDMRLWQHRGRALAQAAAAGGADRHVLGGGGLEGDLPQLGHPGDRRTLRVRIPSNASLDVQVYKQAHAFLSTKQTRMKLACKSVDELRQKGKHSASAVMSQLQIFAEFLSVVQSDLPVCTITFVEFSHILVNTPALNNHRGCLFPAPWWSGVAGLFHLRRLLVRCA